VNAVEDPHVKVLATVEATGVGLDVRLVEGEASGDEAEDAIGVVAPTGSPPEG